MKKLKKYKNTEKNGFDKLRPVPGVIIKQLQVTIPILVDETPKRTYTEDAMTL